MNDDFIKFVETLEASGTKRTALSLKAIGEYDYSDCTAEKLEEIILSLKPNSPRAITTACYVIGLYAKYLENDQLYEMISDIDRKVIWAKAKPVASKKFISHKRFKEVYHDVGMFEELNATYFQTLFRSLYEGIYSEDMSVIKNLKASDIHGNIVTLHEDNGNSYDLEISAELAEDLRELGKNNVWERRNRYGIFDMKIEGLHPDTCFKVEIRNNSSEYSYRFTYYRVLRKIAKEYVEYNLLPVQIFVSGIMYRIGLKLKEQNITIEEAFSEQNRNKIVGKILSEELTRCHYENEVRNFRELVKGHLDVFTIEA